jgi:hypothetical protein
MDVADFAPAKTPVEDLVACWWLREDRVPNARDRARSDHTGCRVLRIFREELADSLHTATARLGIVHHVREALFVAREAEVCNARQC